MAWKTDLPQAAFQVNHLETSRVFSDPVERLKTHQAAEHGRNKSPWKDALSFFANWKNDLNPAANKSSKGRINHMF